MNENKKIQQAKRISIKEGSAASLMEGFGTRYITPYALYLGASNTQIGLLSSFPGLLGSLFQIPALFLIKKNSRKKIVFFSVLFQALFWLPIIAIGFLYFLNYINSMLAANLLIIAYSLMSIAGSTASPPWNSWMKDLLQEKSGEYFGKRNRIFNLIITLGMLLAGIILNYFDKENAFKGFLIIFFIAFVGRSISAYLITKQYEPKFKYKEEAYFSFRDFIKRMFSNNFGHFVIFISLISFATAVAGPFFAVYMLDDLSFSYIEYTIITLSSISMIIVFLPFWGRFADKFGNVKVLRITSFLIPLIPVLWLISVFLPKNSLLILIYLILTETLAGFAWSGFNLSTSNFIYDAVTKPKMAFCIAYFNIINASGAFLGAMTGGIIASQKILIFGIKTIFIIFILSAMLRFLTVLIMSSSIKEVKKVKEFNLERHLKEKLSFFVYSALHPIR